MGPKLTTKLVNHAIRRAFADAISKFSGNPCGRAFTAFATTGSAI